MPEDDRDRYRVRTPPAGVRAQTAPPVASNGVPDWSRDDELTPLPVSTRAAISKLDGRVKTATSDLGGAVAAVRQELRGDIDRVDGKVDQLGAHLIELSTETAKMGGQLELLVSDRAIERTETSTIRTATVTTELKIHEAKEMSAIEEAKLRSARRYTILLKVLAGVGIVWAFITSLVLASK
jgi:hypothetical protein